MSMHVHNRKKNNNLVRRRRRSGGKTTKIITITTAPGKTIGVKSKRKKISFYI